MKTVLCHGCFDVLHAGHLAYFRAAKKFGDYLIVSITTDRYVNKGPGRPYFTTALRAEMVKALGIVDEVVISDSPTAVSVIQQYKPSFYVKGPDYKDLTKDVTGEIHNEKSEVERHGGQLVFTDEETFSSSTIINRFFQGWSDEQRAIIESVKELGGMDRVRKAIDQLEKLNCLVIGEPIIDVYRFCNPEGISSKSPTISARFLYEEKYDGGATAIYSHLKSFCKVRTCNHFGRFPNLNVPIVKTRYISNDKFQRIFEVTTIDESAWDLENNAEAITLAAKGMDIVIAADFGHGLIEGPVLGAIKDIKAFLGLNVQTNSSNFGFNIHTKHERWDYLCLDLREARLAERNRLSPPEDIAQHVYFPYAHMGRKVSMTLGSQGSLLWQDSKEFKSPAFTDNVLDATGAGDAYFAITTCLLATGCQPTLVPFIGNVFAGLKTKIMGNKFAVTKAQLIKACEGILK